MTSMFRTGSSHRKSETPGNIRIKFKGGSSEIVNNEEEDSTIETVDDDDEEEDEDDQLTVTFQNGTGDSPEAAVGGRPQAAEEESTAKKKREPLVRIDTSVLDNVSCTSCGHQINPYKSGAVQKHEQLKVLICKQCEKFLSSGEISKDKDGTDEQCRWCGEGGRLVVCDKCNSAFCKSCVMRNFSRSEFNNINSKDSWHCYLCNQSPLQSLRDNCRKIRETLKALHEKEKAKAAASSAQSSNAGARQANKDSLRNSSVTKGNVASSQGPKGENLSNNNSVGAVINLADVNVLSENIYTTTDRLLLSTNTFRDVLQSLKSQYNLPPTSSFNIHLKKQQHVKALNKSIETFLNSVKLILNESQQAFVVDSLVLDPQQHNNSSVTHTSNKPTRTSNAGGNLAHKKSVSSYHIPPPMPSVKQELDSDNDVVEVSSTEFSPVKLEKRVERLNGDLTKDHSISNVSKSSGSVSKQKEKAALSSPEVRPKVSISNTTSNKQQENIFKDLTKGSNLYSEEPDKANNDKIVDEDADNEKSVTSEKTNSKQGRNSKQVPESTEKEMSSLDEGGNRRSARKKLPAQLAKSSKKTKESNTVAEESSTHDENMTAKFDLIKELADEMMGDERESDEDNVYDNQRLALRKAKRSESENSLKASTRKKNSAGEKQPTETSNEDLEDSTNKINSSHQKDKTSKSSRQKDEKANSSSQKDKKANSSQQKDEKANSSSQNNEKSGKTKKQESEDAMESKDDSSSDIFSSNDDNTDLVSRRRKRTRQRGVKNTTEGRTTRQKQAAAKTENQTKSDRKPATRSRSSGEKLDDIDKEIDKLSKLPAQRKRKVNVSEDDEACEGKSQTDDAKDRKAPKRSKPGPKKTKKGVDYDDLSSDENEEKQSEEDIDDDDDDETGLSVTFTQNGDDVQDQKSLSEDENEKAKKGLLKDLDDDEEDDEDDDDDSSHESAEESDEAEKPVKKNSKDTKNTGAEKEEDSDENIGKRKISSKLLDAKLSDSDSEIGRSKRKKKDDDEESFKADESSDSSIESDLSSSDENDDSENSEDDDDEPKSKKKGKKKQARKRKRKGKGRSDDDDDDEDSEDGKRKKKGKAKRRRIKKMSDSSDDDDSSKDKEEDDDDPNSSKAGKRKQIRKVMSDKKLKTSTKAAGKAEEKRRKRIAAKQREFNIETITDENNPMNCPVTTKLVLEAGKEEGDDPIIQVNKKLVRKLKPHQVEAVQFMWDCMYESVKRSKKEEGAGCILAHCMGLGKTLSVITFVHTILTHEKLLKHRTCLIVSPLNTVLNWKNEWGMWLDEDDQLEVWELAGCKQNALRAEALKDWQESGGIMIIGYEMYRNLTMGNRCKNKKQKKIFQDTLVDPGPDLVVCDEGHILKNEASAISKSMNQMKTRRRVVLTGTPLQNNLNEYHCMVSFVKPNLLGTRREFNNRFISPIQNGQCTDSTPRDFKVMKARAHVLHEMLAGCVQRRDYSALTKFLPPKQEYVISVRLTSIQIELYEKYLELSGQGQDGVYTNKGARLFTDYQNLMKIWTHPWVLKLAEIRDEMKARYDDDEDSFIDDDDDSEDDKFFDSSTSSSEDDKAMSDSAGEGTSSGKYAQRGTRRTRAKARRLAGEDSDQEEVIAEWKSKTRNGKDPEEMKVEETEKSVTKDWWAPYVTEDDKLKLELSNKLFLLFEILRMCEEIGDKVLIFSQSILSLNIIENFLEVIDSKFQQECENDITTAEDEDTEKNFGRSWTKNLDYYRMDGSTSAQNRQLWASSFNDLENYRARLFLISTRAGGLGINLVAANRVIIFDASWNPSHDVQSIFRVYRFGQVKPCYIYRFLAQGTMEEKIYERQVTKLSLSQRVVDEHQIERHFSANDLKELYNFKPDRWDDGNEKPTLALPKDPLLAEILTANKQCVVSFHEHDSLLENQIEQTLTEEEKKAAWEEYENEKKGIIVRGPGMANTSSWPMIAAAQLLSREQIAATIQALRMQLPDVSEDLFQLHLQQALKRQVFLRQEEMRRLEMLRLKEMNYYINMVKQGQQPGPVRGHTQQGMAQWMQMQQRALMGGMPSTSNPWSGQKTKSSISNKPEDAIDLDDN